MILLVDWCLKNNVPVTTAYRWISQDFFPTEKKHGMRWIAEEVPVPILPKGRPKTKNLEKPVPPKTLAVQPDKSSDTVLKVEEVSIEVQTPRVASDVVSPDVVSASDIQRLPYETEYTADPDVPARKRGRPKGSKNKAKE